MTNSLFYYIGIDGVLNFRVLRGANFEENQANGFAEVIKGTEPNVSRLDYIIKTFEVQYVERISNDIERRQEAVKVSI